MPTPNSHKRFTCYVTALLVSLLLSACATPIKPHAEPVSYATSSTDSLQVWKPLHDNLPNDSDTSWFSTLNTGEQSLYRRLALIDTATTSIDAQYFLWLEDAVGSLGFERLLDAADKGVRVRLLLDDSFLAGEDSVVLALDEHPNVDVRIFNPFSERTSGMASRYIENANDFARTNHRMHNKLLIGDSTVAIVGGRNVADDYFGFSKERNFRDYDVITAGKIVPQLAHGFDEFWNSGWAFPVPEVEHKYANEEDFSRLRKDLRAKASVLDDWQEQKNTTRNSWNGDWSALGPEMIEGRAELLLDKPRFDKQTPEQVADRLKQVFLDADDEILGVSAYLIPTDSLMQGIQQQAEKGTRIRFLTNSLASNNHVPAHTAYAHHRTAMLQSGAELYELRPEGLDKTDYEAPGYGAVKLGLHGKVMVFDNDTVFIGTLNLDPRSIYLNTEMGLLIKSKTLNKVVRNELLPGFSDRNSWRVTLDKKNKLNWTSFDGTTQKQPAASFGRRTLDKLMTPLPIDSQM